MRIAVCSLFCLTHVAEFVGAAAELSINHEVRYFLGFECQDTASLLDQRKLAYTALLDGAPEAALSPIAEVRSDFDRLRGYFFRYAELVLPPLLAELETWKP